MFDLSFSEILVVLVGIIIFIKPEDLPEIARFCGKFFGKIKNYYDEIIHTISHEIEDTKEIKGDDGKLYKAYDVEKILPKEDGRDNNK
jgi:Tat protein translocase TatB subunit